MPKLPDINQKESSSSFGSSKKEPRTRRQPILFSNPEKQKVINNRYFIPTVHFDTNDRLLLILFHFNSLFKPYHDILPPV